MSFSIEVGGDANPLSLQGLCQALQAATSHDFPQRQAAGQQLQAWETQPGYYSSLQSVYLDKSLSVDVRFLAVIQLKNGIDKYWRLYSSVKNGIKPDEKQAIRSRLFQGTVEEEDRSLALHNALVIAKIVRIDYPHEWPDALPQIIELLRSSARGNAHHLQGVLQLLLRVVKEMGTARMRRSQTALQSVTPELVYVLGEIYADKSAEWISQLTNSQGISETTDMAMRNSLMALRTVRRLVVVGYETPHKDGTVEQFWTLSQNQFGQLLGLVSPDAKTPGQYQELAGKHLLQFTKFHIDMSDYHAASFVFLPQSLALVHAYWDLIAKYAEVFGKSEGIRQEPASAWEKNTAAAKVVGPLQERLTLKGLILLRCCVRMAFQPVATFKYRTPDTKAEQERAKSIIKTDLFTDELVVQMVNSIITHLFVFRRSDLEAWQEDPEEWEQQEQNEGSAYEWEVRPCAEKLFLDLLTNFKTLLIPPLLEYFNTAQQPDVDVPAKEAVYTAMGLSAAHVVNRFKFDQVLSTTIIQDLQQTGPLYRVLRRRIAILISQWAPVHLEEVSRPIVYRIFCHLLEPGDETNDLVVRVTAARQLRWIVDELGFSVQAFFPYAGEVLSRLSALIQGLENDETKLAILESMRILVTRMEELVSPFSDQLMTVLPAVWEESGNEEYMIKQAVIAIFTALVTSMGSSSVRYQEFMIPLLSEAARPGSDLHENLVDESLELWNAMLMHSSPPLTQDMINMVQLALPLLEYASDTAMQSLTAVESYLLLAPDAIFLGELRRPTLMALSKTLDAKSRQQVRLGTTCLEYMIRTAVERGGTGGVSLIVEDMLETGLINKILTNLHDAWEANQTTGPNSKVSRLNPITENDYFAILARLALAEPTLFMQMLSSAGEIKQVWHWLSDEWFSHNATLDSIERQKLELLGLTRLLELPSPTQELVLGRLQDYLDMWSNVISDLQDGVVDGPDGLVWTEMEGSEYDTPKSVAERDVALRDPVHSVPAKPFVSLRLGDLINRVGGYEKFQTEWAVNVDKAVWQGFQTLFQSET